MGCTRRRAAVPLFPLTAAAAALAATTAVAVGPAARRERGAEHALSSRRGAQLQLSLRHFSNPTTIFLETRAPSHLITRFRVQPQRGERTCLYPCPRRPPLFSHSSSFSSSANRTAGSELKKRTRTALCTRFEPKTEDRGRTAAAKHSGTGLFATCKLSAKLRTSQVH